MMRWDEGGDADHDVTEDEDDVLRFCHEKKNER
jgi:hypothetical protein